MKRLTLPTLLAALSLVPIPLHASQTNFQIEPAPIAYPFFEPGRLDISITGAGFDITAPGITLGGGGAYGIFRYAFNEYLAGDAAIGLFGVGGTMPGIALPFYSYTYHSYYYPVSMSNANLTGVMFPMSFNIEVQALHAPAGSLIFFAGPSFAISALDAKTAYDACGYGCYDGADSSFDVTTVLGGVQFGAQAGINLGDIVRLAPFFMVASLGGSATETYSTGIYNTTPYGFSGASENIPSFTTTSFGMDIIFVPINLSIGSLFQEAAANSSNGAVHTTLFYLTYHFRAA